MPVKSRRWMDYTPEYFRALSLHDDSMQSDKRQSSWHSNRYADALAGTWLFQIVDGNAILLCSGVEDQSTDIQSEYLTPTFDKGTLFSRHHGMIDPSRISAITDLAARLQTTVASNFGRTVYTASQTALANNWFSSDASLRWRAWSVFDAANPIALPSSEFSGLLVNVVFNTGITCFVTWLPHHAFVEGSWRTALSERVLTDPQMLLHALDSTGMTKEMRRQLVLFAETMEFDKQQQLRLLAHLWHYVAVQRTSRDPDDLVALASATRKLIAYFPAESFDELAELLEFNAGNSITPEFEMEFVKGLTYRFAWDSNSTTAQCPHLLDAIYELASFYSSKRSLECDVSGVIAVNAIIALAFLNDRRTLTFVETLSDRTFPWFSSLVRTRATRLHSRLTEQGRSSEWLGLLPEIVRKLSGTKGN